MNSKYEIHENGSLTVYGAGGKRITFESNNSGIFCLGTRSFDFKDRIIINRFCFDNEQAHAIAEWLQKEQDE